MTDAISNTSPLLYLHRLDILGWLPEMFGEIWTPGAVVEELREGQRRGYGKKQGLTERVAPLLKRAEGSGLWVSESVRHRILMLAGEGE